MFASGLLWIPFTLLAEHGGTGIVRYPSWQDKAISLTETFQFFLRLDPFPPAFPPTSTPPPSEGPPEEELRPGPR